MAKKLTKGRQKVPIVKMEKKTNLQVTFSKRRNGLFKKASELCTLTGAEVAIVVFSPGQKAYSFGHPSFESVTDKFLGKNPSPTNDSIGERVVEAAHRAEYVNELTKKLIDLEKNLEAEKNRCEVLHQILMEGQLKFWWQAPIRELNKEQLDKLGRALEGLKKHVENESRKREIQANNLSRYLFERASFGRNVGPSNAMGMPFGARAYGSSGFSPFGPIAVNAPEKVGLDARAPGTGGSNIPHGNEPSTSYQKFF